MAIVAMFTGQGYTKDMYEILRKEVNWEHNQPSGGMFHVASFDKAGNTIHVTDIWESEEQLNKFVSSRLMPVMQKHKMPPPKTEVYEVHNINVFPQMDKFRLR